MTRSQTVCGTKHFKLALDFLCPHAEKEEKSNNNATQNTILLDIQ